MAFLRKYGPGLLVLALGAAFLVLGVARGEQETVFMKASRICMECIGLG